MAKLDWVILCERAIIEAQSNTVSIISTVESVGLPSPPPELTQSGQQIGVPFRFYAVQQWARSKLSVAEETPGRIVLKGPDGKQYGQMDFIVDLTKTPKARVISLALGFPLVGAGAYKCIVQVKSGKGWRALGETEFAVVFTPSPPDAGQAVTKH
jgi:hypothetical protein